MACNGNCTHNCGAPSCKAPQPSCKPIDASCVFYHLDGVKPSLLDCIGVGNRVTVEKILERIDDKICNISTPNPGTWDLKCLATPADPVTSLQEFAEKVATALCDLKTHEILGTENCGAVTTTITNGKIKVCLDYELISQQLINNTNFINGVVNKIVNNPVLKEQFCCPFECALSVDVTGVSCDFCLPPTNISVQGNTSPLTGIQYNYTYTIGGGVVSGIQWSVTGGYIIGSSTGSSVRVQWTDPGSATLSIQLSGCGQQRSYAQAVAVQCDPDDVDCGCVELTDLSIAGVTTVVSNQEYSYQYQGIGTAPRSFYWQVTGGTIIGSALNSSVTVRWGAVGGGTLQLSVVSCLDQQASYTQAVSIGTVSSCTPVTLSQISGSNSVITGSTQTYSVTATGTSPIQYQWNVVGGTITGSSTGSSVTIQWDNQPQTGILTVTSVNCINKSASRTLNVVLTESNVVYEGACGEIISGQYAGMDFHVYPDYPIDVTLADTTVQLAWIVYDRPNQFAVLENGIQIASTGWKGTADYSGPWGTSLSTANTGTLSFTKTAGKQYAVRVTAGNAITLEGTWQVGIICPKITGLTVVPTETPNVFQLSFDGTYGIPPYTWQITNSSDNIFDSGTAS